MPRLTRKQREMIRQLLETHAEYVAWIALRPNPDGSIEVIFDHDEQDPWEYTITKRGILAW